MFLFCCNRRLLLMKSVYCRKSNSVRPGRPADRVPATEKRPFFFAIFLYFFKKYSTLKRLPTKGICVQNVTHPEKWDHFGGPLKANSLGHRSTKAFSSVDSHKYTRFLTNTSASKRRALYFKVQFFEAIFESILTVICS